MKEFTQLTYPADTSYRDAARRDKKKIKTSPNISKKIRYYIPEKNLWIFADTEEKLNRIIKRFKV